MALNKARLATAIKQQLITLLPITDRQDDKLQKACEGIANAIIDEIVINGQIQENGTPDPTLGII